MTIAATPPAETDETAVEPDFEPIPEPEAAPTETVDAATELAEAVSSQSDTAATLIGSLDALAITVGETRVSLWDALVASCVLMLVIMGAWMLTRLFGSLIKRASRLDQTQQLLVQKISTIIIWVAAFFMCIDILGIDLTALAIFSGAFGLAIGFGLQKTFGNLISGILLLLDKSIKPGDVISVTDQAGNESVGQIRKIGIRAISVITRDRTEHLIPNENLMINQVVNWSYSSRDVRVKAPIGVAYGSDLELVTKLLYQAADETERVLRTPKPRVNVMEFGDNSVNFELRFWIDDPEEGLANIRSDVYMNVWRLFKENGVEIPFPQRDINIGDTPQFQQLVAAIAQRMEKD